MKVDIKYAMKKALINKKTINSFKINLDERREIRTGKVASIRTSFNNKEKLKRHFDAPFVVNNIDGVLKVIDGNHRLESIRDQIMRENDFEIIIWMAEYKNLTREEERDIYSKWSCGTKETSTDHLKQHFKVIPLGDEILKRLPTTIYGNQTNFQIKNLLGAHIVAKIQGKFNGGFAGGGPSMVAAFMDIKKNDIDHIAAWYKDVTPIFGTYYKGNIWYTSTAVSSFYRIWYDNKDMPMDKFTDAFNRVFTARQSDWRELVRGGGREAAKLFYNLAIKKLKDDRKRVHWRSDEDIMSMPQSTTKVQPKLRKQEPVDNLPDILNMD